MRIVPLVCLKTATLLLLAGVSQPAHADESTTLQLIGPAARPIAEFADDSADSPNPRVLDSPTVGTIVEPATKTFDLEQSLLGLANDDEQAAAQESATPDAPSPTEASPPAEASPPTETSSPAEASSPAEPADPPASTPLSPQMIDLRNRLRQVLTVYYPKHLVVPQRSCWEVMHGIIAYGVDAKLYRDASRRQTVNAIGWMCYNQPCHGEQLFYLNHGKLAARLGPGLQGHTGQFLAIIAQSHVPASFPMKIGGRNFTVEDLIAYEKSDCRAGEELTFKLISMSHYLGTEDAWTTRDGQTWDVSRLIREELKQPILRVAACGGTHRLMGHSYALYKRRKEGLPIDGQFARAEKFISDYHRYTYSLQNADGSFSTKWFEGRENRQDIDRKIKTSGHIFEWMCFSVPEERLQDPRLVKAANFLVTALAQQPNRQWEIGPLGHALHGLRIYDRRLFTAYDTPADPKSVLEPTTAHREGTQSAPLKLAKRQADAGEAVEAAPDTETANHPHGIAPAVPPIELVPARK